MMNLGTWVIFIILVTRMIAVAQTYPPNGQNTQNITISPLQKEIVLQNGQNFTIKCTGKGPLFLKQQDCPEEIFGYFHTELRRETSADPNYETLALDLYNADQFAVGYYACFDDMVDGYKILNDLKEEPNDTEHVSYIYIYVNGSSSLFAPMRQTLLPASKSEVVIGCRPTAPDIKVTLSELPSNKTTDFVKFSPKIGYLLRNSRPAYKCNGQRGKEMHSETIEVRYISPPEPKIYGRQKYILGETFTINCTIPYLQYYSVELNWIYPGANSTGNIRIVSNEMTPEVNANVYKNITVINATKDNEGNYVCKSTVYDSKYKNITKELVTPYLKFVNLGKKNITTHQQNFLKYFKYDAYPPLTSWSFSKDGKIVKISKEKYYIVDNGRSISVLIKDSNILDTGNYTIFVSNKECNVSYTFELKIEADPVAQIVPEVVKCPINKTVTLKCVVTGYPLPSVKWNYASDIVKIKNEYVVFESIYKKTATIEVSSLDSTNITCIAGGSTATQALLVYEVDNGFQIKDSDETWYPENQPFVKQCVASKYDFIKVYWSRKDDVSLDSLTKYSDNELSYYATLIIDQIALNDAGELKCIGLRANGSKEVLIVNITVAETQLPVVVDSDMEQEVKVFQFQPVQLNCFAEAIPLPQIEWQKDDVTLKNMSNTIITTINLNKTTVNSTLDIHQVQENDTGKYVCKVLSGKAELHKTFNVVLKDKTMYKTIITVTVVVIIVLFAVMIYLIWKIRKEKQFKRELKAIGLYFFKNGVPKSINPDLFIDEQAELLPYDEKFEFPLDKLSLGKQLGAGAFGVVYKAEARGIIDAEKTTTVAVKMVKKTADNMYIKALASELKIMVHLGKHVNIVNLLGACTKNIARRELLVIVEYCKFGNIHNYLLKHREVFIDQLTDSKESQFGKINSGYSCSSENSGMQSDYFGSNHTQLTDHTFVNNTANTNRYSQKISEPGYVMYPEPPEPTYESDCSFLRALCTRDLLCWAFQIARGMEYLTSRKVLHGDLAARNILLAEDNVVKICDFGLSRSMYKNDEYLKKGDGLLPVKWLAIECMTDRIFSTQSDVWAFGIVLWELFSLAKTPYPNIRLENVLQWLLDGNRLERPQHADDRLYNMMRSCWEQKPTLRPTFIQLQETLGSFLEDNVRNHYIDLNATYVDLNKRTEAQEDYLAMVCAPDYNIMTAPSPHNYVNGKVAQMQIQHDSEGYLQTTPTPKQNIFSPRPQGTQFDFEVKKLNKTPKFLGNESELTPMLPINKLVAVNGSESDIECNLSPSPNPCPRIEEETDNVFESVQNNVKNVQDMSVSATNPIYITVDDSCFEKNSQLNKYANVPNG